MIEVLWNLSMIVIFVVLTRRHFWVVQVVVRWIVGDLDYVNYPVHRKSKIIAAEYEVWKAEKKGDGKLVNEKRRYVERLIRENLTVVYKSVQ